MTFEVGRSARVRAFHRMEGMPGPEGRRHPHEYRIEVVVERRALDERGMVIDLDVLAAALEELTGTMVGADLDDALPEHRGGVTVELLARWAHGVLRGAVRTDGGEALAVRVFESEDAFGGFRGPA
ncbi:MAG TPA: 6-carboxytetrahydropterin synthase [Actinomycetota bacterium]|nr:6-carboxytetrahydropterin synthase [Actinomycetota bacterium]